jgi:hypothetical protein
MEGTSRGDIRRMLKSLGIQADEAVSVHLAWVGGGSPLHIRLSLKDQTDCGDDPPKQSLRVEIEGQIRRP